MTSYFLAGIMQGDRTGDQMADQGYRATLTEVIRRHEPDAVVQDPGMLMIEWLAADEAVIRGEHRALTDRVEVRRDEHGPGLVQLVDVFHRLVDISADCDVCVVWLPGQEASMGTACEMFAAHRAGKQVVAISTNRQNLALLACADVILPDLAAFELWLKNRTSGVNP